VGELGEFTDYNEPFIDEEIQKQLHTIVSVILKRIPYVLSVIVKGGFGRGEGSVIISGPRVRPLRDYDIIVVSSKSVPSWVRRKVLEEVHRALGLKPPWERVFKFSDFVIDITFTTPKRLKLYVPDIATYELKVASKIIYGQDVRYLIECRLGDITLSSGLRVLFVKVTGLIGALPEHVIRCQLTKLEEEALIYECHKTYIEICTALSLIMGTYVPSFKARAKAFKKFFAKKLPDLYTVLPELPKMVEEATAFKLRPDFAKVSEDPVEFWFRTRDVLVTVTKYYIHKFVGVSEGGLIAFCKEALRRLDAIYFTHFSTKFARAFLKSSSRLAERLVYMALKVYCNGLTFLEVLKRQRRFPISLLLGPFVALRIYMAGLLLLPALRKDGTLHPELAKETSSLLRPLVPVKSFSWEMLRRAYLRAYYLNRGFK